ncbi:MAG TPA: hypothetical protein VK759_04335, partial [Rhizomicrobium sp.]|nr:hypothetical protein [Rhizomicrobium sp.]
MRAWLFALFAACILAAGVWAATYPPHPDTVPDITPADLSARDKAIADDAFQGRGPGTEAGEAAAQWLADEMKRIGLEPGNNGSYFQPVPAVNITLDGSKSTLTFTTPKETIAPKFPDDSTWWTPQYARAEV